jgi:hypothetical protein
MDIQIFTDLFSIGLHPLPIVWNEKTKQADYYPDHVADVQSGNGHHDLNDVKRWLVNLKVSNAVALKLHPPFFMFDFDLKNTENKNLYHLWANAVRNISESSFSKLCIEETRSGGYHVYGKYKKVTHKISLAASPIGAETISVYTGGLLSFCSPTPGYRLIQNDFTDIEELTDEEYDLMVAQAQTLNEYEEKETDYKPGEKLEYPHEYESMAVQFDIGCPDDLWENLLNSITLFPCQGDERKRKKRKFDIDYYLYLREGSKSSFSAKVRFDRKRLFLFSGSFIGYPNFHTKINEKDTSWHLTPTRLLYYREGKDWTKTISLIKQHSKEFDIKIIEGREITDQPLIKDRTKFPYDIFPDSVQQFIRYQRIQHEYLAGAVLGAASGMIGNACWLEAMQGYIIKPILYMAIVAPPGASKSPALAKAFRPIEDIDKSFYVEYAKQLTAYKEDYALYEKDKKKNDKPSEPQMRQILIKDSTIEKVVHILTNNGNGCCILADELVGFLNRMNQYKNGDEIQKWLELWSGASLLLQRITREVNKLEDPFCSIVGGIQDGVLEMMATEQNQHNGFYHRFLFLYPEPQAKIEWQQVNIPYHIIQDYTKLFNHLYRIRGDRLIYRLDPDANALYKTWFDNKNAYYNKATSDNIKGIIAKYQDYCLRFALIIQVINDIPEQSPVVTVSSMEKAIRLTEYFLGNMHKALKILTPETPLDNLQAQWSKLYNTLPVEFTSKEFEVLAASLGLKVPASKSFLLRNSGKLFKQIGRGTWEKLI